jgi:hypothetical protein
MSVDSCHVGCVWKQNVIVGRAGRLRTETEITRESDRQLRGGRQLRRKAGTDMVKDK